MEGVLSKKSVLQKIEKAIRKSGGYLKENNEENEENLEESKQIHHNEHPLGGNKRCFGKEESYFTGNREDSAEKWRVPEGKK